MTTLATVPWLQVVETLLVVFSVVLPVVGVWRGYRAVRRDLDDRAAVWHRWEVLRREHPGGGGREAGRRLRAEYPTTTSVLDATYLRELIAYLIVSDKVPGLRCDLIIVLVGLAAGLAAGLIGVWA